jgi:threonine dehydrogenase-like Zn-dependent dehydrogenase
MPRELIATAPGTPAFRDYEDTPLTRTQIRIRTQFASPKHGTELVGFRDEPAAQRSYDPAIGAVMPRTGRSGFPRGLGNMAVGEVIETGPDVSRFRIGDRVFGHFSIRETHTVDETNADPVPEGLSDEALMCLDPAVMAFSIRDVRIGLGDRVAVFGLGAIGLMAVQMARLSGASWIVAIDPIPARRALATAFGADVVLDTTELEGDTGLAIRNLTAPFVEADPGPSPRTRLPGGYWEQDSQRTQLGVDVAIEGSGAIRALHQAVRATRFGGTICMLSFYGRDAAGLHLGEEFHINQLSLVSARAESLPLRDLPGWTLGRMVRTTLAWLSDGTLQTDGLITPVVQFQDADDAYREIAEHPERSIKLGIRFG